MVRITAAVLLCVVISAAAAIVLAEPRRPADVCMDPETREQVRIIMLAAIDEALKQQITHLFEVWMKSPEGQPDRAQIGATRAIRAYQGSRIGVLKWSPPECATAPP